MNRHCTKRIGRALALGMGVLAGWLLGDSPAAGDVIVFENEEVPAAAAVVQFDNLVMANAEVPMIRLTREQAEEYFVKSVFRNQRSLDAARQTAENALGQQVEHVAQIGTLLDEQRAKLELAGQGDICRFFNEFAAVLQAAPLGPLPMHEWQQAWNETQQKLQPLQSQYHAGLHGEGSLFRKTIPSALSSEQFLAFQTMEDERNRKRYRALVKATLAAIDNTVPLTADQREQIIKLVVEKTKLPQGIVDEGSTHHQFVLYQMSQIQDDLKPLFTGNEWRRMQTILRHGEMMERLIRQQERLRGAVPDAFGVRPLGLRFRGVGRAGAQIEGDVILDWKDWEVDRARRVEAFDRARQAKERAFRQALEMKRLQAEKIKREALRRQMEKLRAKEEVEKIPDR